MMHACNRYSNLTYEELPTLFFEFHGGESVVENQAKEVGEFTILLHFKMSFSSKDSSQYIQHQTTFLAKMRKGEEKGILNGKTNVPITLSLKM